MDLIFVIILGYVGFCIILFPNRAMKYNQFFKRVDCKKLNFLFQGIMKGKTTEKGVIVPMLIIKIILFFYVVVFSILLILYFIYNFELGILVLYIPCAMGINFIIIIVSTIIGKIRFSKVMNKEKEEI